MQTTFLKHSAIRTQSSSTINKWKWLFKSKLKAGADESFLSLVSGQTATVGYFITNAIFKPKTTTLVTLNIRTSFISTIKNKQNHKMTAWNLRE